MEDIYNLENIDETTHEQIIDYFDHTTDLDKTFDYYSNREKCDKCRAFGTLLTDMQGGMIICTNCGQCTESILDHGPESRQYDEDKNEMKSGNIPINKLLPQSSLGTTIGGSCRGRLKILHAWCAMPYEERSKNTVFKIIEKRCRDFDIPKCIEDDAKIMYNGICECKRDDGKQIGKRIIIRGLNRVSLIAACVFFGCKRNGMTRSPKEIAKIFDIKYTDMTKGCKNFSNLYKTLKINKNKDLGTSKPEDFITRFCKELKIKEPYISKTLQIAKNISKLNIASIHTPTSAASCCILLMADINNLYHISRKLISAQFNISEVTLSKTFRKIEIYKKALVDDNLTNKICEIIKQSENNYIIPKEIEEKADYFKGIINEDIEYNSDDEIYDCDVYDDTKEILYIDNNYNNDNIDNNYNKLDYIEIDILLKKMSKLLINNDVMDIIDQINIELYDMFYEIDYLYNKLIDI